MPRIDRLITAAFDAANDAIAIAGNDRQFLYINKAFTALYGYTWADVTNMRMSDFRSPPHREGFDDVLRDAERTGGLAYDTEHQRSDGTVFPVGVRISRVNVDGVAHWVFTLRDISQRKAMQANGAKLRRLYDALLTANRAVVQASDRITLFTHICDICTQFGFSLAWVGVREGDTIIPVAAAGKSVGYINGVRLRAQGDDPSAQGPTATALRTGRAFICNDVFAEPALAPWHDRARAYQLEACATFPLMEGGRPIGAMTIYADHSGFFGSEEIALLDQFSTTVSMALDRLAAEDASRNLTDHPIVHTILNAVPAIVFVAHDPGAHSISANSAGEILLRIPAGANASKSDSRRNPHVRIFRHGVELSPHEYPVKRAASGEVIASDEIELRFDDGAAAFLQGNAIPLRDASGAVTGAVAAFIDVTQRRKEQQQLIEARNTAEKAMAAKARFLAAVSHDLRQPLQGLVLLLDVLANKLSPTGVDAFNKARSCADTLSDMVNDLLDVAKLDAGVIAVNIEDCGVGQLLADIVPAHEASAVAKGLTLRYVPSRAMVRTDPALMRRIVGNLLSNAVKYTREGGIVIGCRRHAEKAVIEVWDSGIGIPADRLNDIFEEFWQMDNPERSRDKGSGLGLAVVDRSARLLGVKVKVASTPGRGSCFAVEIPLA